jgi:cytosine/adenosine deaminase-related metal-dependent hydrolase
VKSTPAGSLVLPGLFNLHLHADKCLLGEIMRPNLSGTLPEAIEITNDFKRKYDPAEVAERASRAIEAGVKNGTTFFRLFADVARSADFVPRGVCCSPVKSSAAIATSRSWRFRRKASCATLALPN